MPKSPSPFSKHNPKLQLAWDASSYGALLFCPRFYQYTIVEGFRFPGNSVHLEFGRLFASSVETFSLKRLEGYSKEEATLAAVQYAVENSGFLDEDGKWHPWGGEWKVQWRCTGTEPYRNEKGNRAKCPYSHKGKWFDPPEPAGCGLCDSEIELRSRWLPENKEKNRNTLVRLVCWYCDEQPEEEGIQPITINGRPAVELSLRTPLPFINKYGERYILAGYVDRLVDFQDENWIADNKTTKKTLGKTYWSTWRPNYQMETYDILVNATMPELKTKGVLIEAAQALVGGAEFGTMPIRYTDTQREEYLRDLEYWLGQAEKFAEDDYWPMNRRSCGFCSLRTICAMPTEKRRLQSLKADYEVKKWNPLEDRN